MNTNDITKALQSASQLLKGAKPKVTLSEVEDAMVALGDLRKNAGETPAACFARLVADSDRDIITLSKAKDLLECAGARADAALRKRVTPYVHEASEMLDEYVALKKRAGEDTASAFSRLAREENPGFVRLFTSLRNAQNHA